MGSVTISGETIVGIISLLIATIAAVIAVVQFAFTANRNPKTVYTIVGILGVLTFFTASVGIYFLVHAGAITQASAPASSGTSVPEQAGSREAAPDVIMASGESDSAPDPSIADSTPTSTNTPTPTKTETPPTPAPTATPVNPSYSIYNSYDYHEESLELSVSPDELLCLTTGRVAVPGTTPPFQFPGEGRASVICWIGPQEIGAYTLLDSSVKRVRIDYGDAHSVSAELIQQWVDEMTTHPLGCGPVAGPCSGADTAIIWPDGTALISTVN